MSGYNNPYGGPGGYPPPGAPPQPGGYGYGAPQYPPPHGPPGGGYPQQQPPYPYGGQQQQPPYPGQHQPYPGQHQQQYHQQQPPYGGGGGGGGPGYGYGQPPQPPQGGPPPGAYYGAPPAPPPGPAAGSGGPETYLNVTVAPLPTHGPPPPAPGFDAHTTVEKIRKATKGFGTDEALLISAIAPLDSWQATTLSHTFKSATGKDIVAVIEKETSGQFENVLRAKALDAVFYDAWLVHRAVAGLGTNEALLNEVLLARNPRDMWLLKEAYRLKYNNSLERAVEDDLSFKTKRLFTMAMAMNRPDDRQPVDQNLVQHDVANIHKSARGAGTDEIAIANILVNRNYAHLAAVCRAYEHTHRKMLSKVILDEFSGHMEDALLYIVLGAEGDGNGIQRDAKLLEDSMAGMGTQDELLVARVVRAAWNRPRFEEIKRFYASKYHKKGLKHRVEKETSGDYERALVAIIGS